MTREEAIHFAECLKRNYTIDFEDMEVFCDMAIKALEQEPVLEKIKAEIEGIEINGYIRDVECFNEGINVALNVINKYKAERGDTE